MIDAEIEAIRQHVRSGASSRRQLAIVAGVHRNTLADMFGDGWNPTADTIRALRTAINAQRAFMEG